MNKKIIRNALACSLVFFICGFIYIKFDGIAYSNVLNPARAVIIGDLKKYSIDVIYATPDWMNDYMVIETSSYPEFKNQCFLEGSSPVYHPKEGLFCVLVPKYDQIWQYKIVIIKQYEALSPFYKYVWENSIS